MSNCEGPREEHRSRLTTFHFEVRREALSFLGTLANLIDLESVCPLSFLILCKGQRSLNVFTAVPLGICIYNDIIASDRIRNFAV
jgi:hypothetical protein